ncbi:hypothetical protein ABZ371_09725 [Streptomyces sp. NPDC005899]|uniref:hypothetical protein n=1 Tax=Streptomyces sp. NPDC005899 TaxID=3155716 RepID=UPI0033FE1587
MHDVLERTPRRESRRRPAAASIAAILCFLAAMLAFANPAGARESGLLDLTCTPPSSASVTYTPPLTNAPQTASSNLHWELGPCVSLSRPDITAGTHTVQNPPRQRSCLELLASGAVTRTITWNTGETSTLSMNRTTTVVGAALIVTHTGTVTSGVFAGDTVVVTEAGPAAAILTCTLGLGSVSSVYNVLTMEITSL